MKLDKAILLTEGLIDFEEIKTNLMLAGADYEIERHGRGERVNVKCEDGSFLVCQDGRIYPI
jgi:hypothetical protein